MFKLVAPTAQGVNGVIGKFVADLMRPAWDEPKVRRLGLYVFTGRLIVTAPNKVEESQITVLVR
jgi:hypothetical protein